MAASDAAKEKNSPQPTRMQVIGYLIIIPAVFTTLMTIVLGISLGLFRFEPQIRALQSFGHSLPLVGSLIPAPLSLPQDEQKLSLDEEKQAVQSEWEKLDVEKKQVEQRSKELDQQTKALAEAAQKLSEQQQDKGDHEAKIQKIVETYSAMKPADAARLLNDLPDTTVLEILAGMDTTLVGEILSAMNSQRAVAVTQLLRR